MRYRLLFGLALGLVLMSACTITATTPGVRVATPGVVVYQPPPPPRVVAYRPPAPVHGAVWVEGHYQWQGNTYVWADGYWEYPRAGYVYVQPRWDRQGHGYVYHGGGWHPHGHGHVPPHHGQVHTRPHGQVHTRPHTHGGEVIQVR